MSRTHIPFGLVAAFALMALPIAAEAVTAPNWQSAPAACLPGRAAKWQKDLPEEKQASCHCPPLALCPSVAVNNMQEFYDKSQLPPGITTACCPTPVCAEGTDLAGQPLPLDGDCTTAKPSCPSGFYSGSYKGPYQAFTYGAVVGPSIGSVDYTGCLPICPNGDTLFAETSINGDDWLGQAWVWENVPNSKTTATDGHVVYIACRHIAQANDCLRSDSQVTLADGSSKSIDAIKIGDHLKGPKGDVEVISVNRLSGPALFYRINHLHFAITGDHPIQTATGWKAADDTKKYKNVVGRLEIGDKLVTEGGLVQVQSIEVEKRKEGTSSVNIRTAGDKAFFVDGVAIKPFKDVQFTY